MYSVDLATIVGNLRQSEKISEIKPPLEDQSEKSETDPQKHNRRDPPKFRYK